MPIVRPTNVTNHLTDPAGKAEGSGRSQAADDHGLLIAHDENDKAVASAVISLGQNLNLRVTAEGVETEDQVAFLRENNCDEMQGYHFSKPIPPHDIEELLRAMSH